MSSSSTVSMCLLVEQRVMICVITVRLRAFYSICKHLRHLNHKIQFKTSSSTCQVHLEKNLRRRLNRMCRTIRASFALSNKIWQVIGRATCRSLYRSLQLLQTLHFISARPEPCQSESNSCQSQCKNKALLSTAATISYLHNFIILFSLLTNASTDTLKIALYIFTHYWRTTSWA